MPKQQNLSRHAYPRRALQSKASTVVLVLNAFVFCLAYCYLNAFVLCIVICSVCTVLCVFSHRIYQTNVKQEASKLQRRYRRLVDIALDESEFIELVGKITGYLLHIGELYGSFWFDIYRDVVIAC